MVFLFKGEFSPLSIPSWSSPLQVFTDSLRAVPHTLVLSLETCQEAILEKVAKNGVSCSRTPHQSPATARASVMKCCGRRT